MHPLSENVKKLRLRFGVQPATLMKLHYPTAMSFSAVRKLESMPQSSQLPLQNQARRPRRPKRRPPAEDPRPSRNCQPPQGRGDHPGRPRSGQWHHHYRTWHARRRHPRPHPRRRQAAERALKQQRYYMLNKPRGYVTTLDRPAETPHRYGPDVRPEVRPAWR